MSNMRNIDAPPPPLTEEEVANITARLAKLDSKTISMICDGYTRHVKGIINTIKKSLDPSEDEDQLVEVDRLQRLINLAPSDVVFIRSKDKIWHARTHILNKNEKYFLDRDYSTSIKHDQKQVMIETLISIIQTKFRDLTNEEKDVYWDKACEILKIVCEYKKLTGEK